MPGKIRRSDIDEVRARTNIGDVIGQYVTLKPAGVGSLKGLCPFHDERSPSFHVRPQVGFYHCFGCGEGGDVFTFLQKYEHMSFAEAVEELAKRLGMQLHYEDGPGHNDGPNRARLLQANSAAAAYYQRQLQGHEARFARQILVERGFDRAAAEKFGLGYAPKGWSHLHNYLSEHGYKDDELIQVGLCSKGKRGAYDRFRGRLIWPIHDVTGQTIGFGARKIYDDDEGPKYLNTPETPVYHKSQVLYGLDLAKRSIGKQRRAIIVEGYTDVMACHLAGVDTAVATCGTAFGAEHVKVLRRILADDQSRPAEVIFTFDPDEAGQKAAMRAFNEDDKFVAQTYVAIPPDGLDPSDLRQYRGDEAVRDVFEAKEPLFRFAIRQIVSRYDLETVEGRTAAIENSVPLLRSVRDQSQVSSYAREIAGFVGVPVAEVQRQWESEKRRKPQPQRRLQTVPSTANTQATRLSNGEPQHDFAHSESDVAAEPQQEQPEFLLQDMPRTQRAALERDAIEVLLQYPELVSMDVTDQVLAVQFTIAPFAEIAGVISNQRDLLGSSNRVEEICALVGPRVRGLVQQLAVQPLPVLTAENVRPFVSGVVVGLLNNQFALEKQQLLGRLQRLENAGQADESRAVQRELMLLEARRRQLLES